MGVVWVRLCWDLLASPSARRSLQRGGAFCHRAGSSLWGPQKRVQKHVISLAQNNQKRVRIGFPFNLAYHPDQSREKLSLTVVLRTSWCRSYFGRLCVTTLTKYWPITYNAGTTHETTQQRPISLEWAYVRMRHGVFHTLVQVGLIRSQLHLYCTAYCFDYSRIPYRVYDTNNTQQSQGFTADTYPF